MYEKIMYFDKWAQIIKDEILSDQDTTWYHPYGLVTATGINIPNNPGSFAQGRMKFINRNLNYFYFKSMVKMATSQRYEFNSKYINTLAFCNYIRPYVSEFGPFGRMCIWKLPPNCSINPHVDNLTYHSHITRYIFCIGDQAGPDASITINKCEIEVRPGLLFNFYPYHERHEFKNNTDTDWFFLGFDYWNLKLLDFAKIKYDITESSDIHYSPNFGIKSEQYMSEH